MKSSFLKTWFFLFVIIASAVFFDAKFFDHGLSQIGPAVVKKPSSYLFAKLESARFFLLGVVKIKDIIKEIEDLKKENFNLLSQLADYDDLKDENDFLRKAINASVRLNKRVAYADIFYFQLGPEGYDVLLNKGANGGIFDGDIIITEGNILVGKVEKTYDNFSRALVVNDTEFNVAVKVLNSSTAGIAKGALNQGMYLDLVVQSDSIKEGDMVVSSGMDLLPPSLIIGTVSYVDNAETGLFKKVKIKPAVEQVKIGRVLVIRQLTINN